MEDRCLYKAKHSVKDKGWQIGSGVMFFADDKDEETLCQCTGLKDKNGDLIWENDIIKVCGDEYFYTVAWSGEDAMFVLESDGEIENFGNVDSKWCEVIGNKFDNPELLERM